ncbi:hypothetical protein ACSQ8B_02645 [Marinovum sp. F03]|uniref:hypothetical protein n=1 Tax=Marinovum sp. F03 TaxID=3449226 RepID=UPI003EDCB147
MQAVAGGGGDGADLAGVEPAVELGAEPVKAVMAPGKGAERMGDKVIRRRAAGDRLLQPVIPEPVEPGDHVEIVQVAVGARDRGGGKLDAHQIDAVKAGLGGIGIGAKGHMPDRRAMRGAFLQVVVIGAVGGEAEAFVQVGFGAIGAVCQFVQGAVDPGSVKRGADAGAVVQPVALGPEPDEAAAQAGGFRGAAAEHLIGETDGVIDDDADRRRLGRARRQGGARGQRGFERGEQGGVGALGRQAAAHRGQPGVAAQDLRRGDGERGVFRSRQMAFERRLQQVAAQKEQQFGSGRLAGVDGAH